MIEATHHFGEQQHGAADDLAAGARVGAWRVLKVIGRGGMGDVYLAERADQSFDKKVALKLVQGLITPTARARFAAEKQALARLEHPHIARLMDAGETEDGWPYLIMEFVDGMPIDHFLADRSVEGVLAIFLQVCEALAYAHRQLVLHRDIKPTNILVDREGNAKLLDFGIAKLLLSETGVEDSHTVERAYTPSYASPEQVFGRPIGVASDIYSLGVLLYRLLTGVSPYTVDPNDTAALVHALSDDDVVPPSRAILGDGLPLSGPHRRRRSRILVGDLDTIMLTALRKQPERRYASVDAFAEDIRHYLASEPIRAQPDSLGYRAGKFLRRNTIGVAAAFAVSLALIVGLVASLWQAHIANEQRALAEQRFEDVRGLAHSMIFDLNDQLVKLPGSTTARKTLVNEALTYLQKLGAENDKSLPLRRELAEAWLRVGDVQGSPMMPNIADLHGALSSYAHAQTYADSLLAAAPGDPGARLLQARILQSRADILYETNALDEADAAYHQAAQRWLGLRGVNPTQAGNGLANAQIGMGKVMFWRNRREDALHYFDLAKSTSLAAGPGDQPLLHGIFQSQLAVLRGETLDWLGRSEEARTSVREGLNELLVLQKANPDNAQIRHSIAMTWMKLAENSYDLKDKRPVLEASENAHAMFAAEVALDPADMRAKQFLALSDQESGDALVELKRFEEALARYHSALKGEQELVALAPRDETVRQDLGNTLYGIAGLYQEWNQIPLAIDAFRQTIAVRQALVDQDPKVDALNRDLAQVHGDLAAVLPAGKDACSEWITSDALWQSVVKSSGAPPTDEDDVAQAHKHAAGCR